MARFAGTASSTRSSVGALRLGSRLLDRPLLDCIPSDAARRLDAAQLRTRVNIVEEIGLNNHHRPYFTRLRTETGFRSARYTSPFRTCTGRYESLSSSRSNSSRTPRDSA